MAQVLLIFPYPEVTRTVLRLLAVPVLFACLRNNL